MRRVIIFLLLIVLISSAFAAPKLATMEKNPLPLQKITGHEYEPSSTYAVLGLKYSSPVYFKLSTGEATGEATVFKGLGSEENQPISSAFLSRFLPFLAGDDQKSNSHLRAVMAENPEALGYLDKYDQKLPLSENINSLAGVVALGVPIGVLMLAGGNSSGSTVTQASIITGVVLLVAGLYFSNDAYNYLDKAVETYNKK